jgi:putative membrane protein
MKKASKFLTELERQRIEEAVAAAESKTSAEIIPMIATDSGRYDRAEDVAGVWLGVILMSLAWLFLRSQSAEEAQWGSTWSRFELPVLILSVVVGFIVGAFCASYISWARRVFTPRREMRDEVATSAAQAFFNRRVHHTEGGTGLLIYVSMFERMVMVLGDQAVLDSLGKGPLDELCHGLTVGIREGDLATSICDTIEKAGERLSQALPRTDGDRNELHNALVIQD